MSEYVCSLPQLKELMAYWVKQLHLEAWDIQLSFANRDELTDEDGNTLDGVTTQIPVNETATIKILNNEGYRKGQKDWPFPQDMEVTLVHELLHLAWRPFEPEEDNVAGLAWHRQLERTAKLYVALKRGKIAA